MINIHIYIMCKFESYQVLPSSTPHSSNYNGAQIELQFDMLGDKSCPRSSSCMVKKSADGGSVMGWQEAWLDDRLTCVYNLQSRS